MININENGRVDARDIYTIIGAKARFNDWMRNSFHFIDAKEGIDFYYKNSKSTGGRPSIDYELTVKCAKEVCLVQPNEKSKALRLYLIGLSEQKENLELITVKEAAFAVKVINALKYIENQKEAYSLHQKSFIEKEGISKYVYADFAKYRAKIVGWDKEAIDKALTEFLNQHSGYNRNKLSDKSMSFKLSVIDVNEAIRVAVLDILFTKGTEKEIAYKFAKMVKEMAKELDVEPLSKNETNLFQTKQAIDFNEIKNLNP